MIAKSAPTHVGRIMLGMKSASQIAPAVDAASVLAEVINVDLFGLFVEEDAMINLAGLPFARAVDLGGGEVKPLTPQLIEQTFARNAETCRKAIEAGAGSSRVSWTFKTSRGQVSGEIESAVEIGDLLVLAGECRGLASTDLLREMRSVPAGTRGMVIVTERCATRTKGPVVAIDDGDAIGADTVSLAAGLAASTDNKLVVLAVAATQAIADRISVRASGLAGSGTKPVLLRHLPGSTESISRTLTGLSPSFVVADMEGEPFISDQSLLAVLRAADAPVVLLRPQ